MRRWLAAFAFWFTCPAGAAGWQFDAPIDVSGPRLAFHHIEASGRQALAVSDGHIAITWEDDRDGAPGCRLAVRNPGQATFSEIAFGQGECYAPGLAALPAGRFALIWEDTAGIGAAAVLGLKLGATVRLARQGSQGALAWHPKHGLIAAWSEPDGRKQRIWLNRLHVKDDQLTLGERLAADRAPNVDDQSYPALACTASGYTVAWEDRRLGHTVIFANQSPDGLTWSSPVRVSQNQTGRAPGTDLGRGTGAMRPALAAFADRLALTWLDKRDFLSGYDVYAAIAGPDGQFGHNIKVQDSFGDAIAQWHASVAGNARGALAVAWDDDRDGNPDIWLSWPTGAAFSENFAAVASAESQSDPVMAIDESGNLHLAWIERQADTRSGIRYRVGRPLD